LCFVFRKYIFNYKNDGIVKYNTIIAFIKKSTYQLSKNKLSASICYKRDG